MWEEIEPARIANIECMKESFEKSRLGGRKVSMSSEGAEFPQKNQKAIVLNALETRAKYPEVVQMLQDMLDGINFDTVADIFREFGVRSGVEEKSLNFIPKEQIYIIEDATGALMSYFPDVNRITINALSFASKPEWDVRDKTLVDVVFTHALFHEYTHATGLVDCVGESVPFASAGSNVSRQRVGFDDMSLDMPAGPNSDIQERGHTLYKLLNEGITERVADEVLLEYVRRVSDEEYIDFEAKENLAKVFVGMDNNLNSLYATAKRFVGVLTQHIAEESGVPEEVVWRAMIRQYYSGELKTEEVTRLLSEFFGSGFTEALAQSKSAVDLMNLLDSSKKQDQYAESVSRWLEYLKLTRNL